MWRHKNLKLWNYGIWCNIRKEHHEKCPLAKNQPPISFWERDISTFMLWWHHTNPSNFASVHNVMNWGKIKRICMGSLEHKSAHISPPNYNRMLNFGKWTFFVMLFLNTSSNPIISQWCHHFRTLYFMHVSINSNVIFFRFQLIIMALFQDFPEFKSCMSCCGSLCMVMSLKRQMQLAIVK